MLKSLEYFHHWDLNKSHVRYDTWSGSTLSVPVDQKDQDSTVDVTLKSLWSVHPYDLESLLSSNQSIVSIRLTKS